MKPLLLILAFAFSVSAQSNRLGISIEYDKFADVTTVKDSQSIMPVRPGFVLLQTVALVRGQFSQGSTPHEVALVVDSYSDEWVFLGQTLTFRVLHNDKERYSLGTMRRISGDVRNGGVREVMYLEVSFEAIEKLIKADKVEIQIGPLESEIKSEQLASFKEWIALFNKPLKTN